MLSAFISSSSSCRSIPQAATLPGRWFTQTVDCFLWKAERQAVKGRGLGSGVAMWSIRVYTRKKRVGQRLNLTPTLDLGPTAKVEAPPGPGRRHSAHRKPQLTGPVEQGPGWASTRAGVTSPHPRDTRGQQAGFQGFALKYVVLS